MLKSWLALFLPISARFVHALQSFENTAIVRTVELGGAVVHVTTTYAIKSLEDSSTIYTVALGQEERKKTSYIEAKVKGQLQALPIKEHAFDGNKDYHLIDITLPQALAFNKTTNIVFETLQTHVTYPWPQSAGQKDSQALKYTTDIFVLSPYPTLVQRTKLKASTPRIISHTTPENTPDFTDGESVTLSGATVVYGPYNHLPLSASHNFITKHQKPITIHYHHDQPVLEVFTLRRAIEISHWGANMNTQDEIVLHNAGPKLKGHFSRLDHQSLAYFNTPAPHALPAISLQLPAGIRNTYYYDLIGNVSTSRLRVTPSVPKHAQGSQFSILELRPRYPIMGGWNYSFTLGWDAPLSDSTSYDKSSGKYIVEVPIMIPLPAAVVDDAELKVILPEGATDVEFSSPFPAISNEIVTHVTYLDTIGRPALIFKYKNLTIKHAQSIYVSYKVSTMAHFKKPIAVAASFFGVFAFALFARRVNLSISPKKKAL